MVPQEYPGSSSESHPGGNTSPDPIAPQLALIDAEEQRLYSDPLVDDRASHHISKGKVQTSKNSADVIMEPVAASTKPLGKRNKRYRAEPKPGSCFH